MMMMMMIHVVVVSMAIETVAVAMVKLQKIAIGFLRNHQKKVVKQLGFLNSHRAGSLLREVFLDLQYDCHRRRRHHHNQNCPRNHSICLESAVYVRLKEPGTLVGDADAVAFLLHFACWCT